MKKITMILCLLACSLTFAADRNISIRTNPIGLLVGAINAEISYGFKNIAVGMGGHSWDASLGDLDFKSSQLHARVDYWFNGSFNQGWYLGVLLGTLDIEVSNGLSSGELDTTFTSLAGGYRWAWTSFFMDLGLQLTRVAASEIETVDSSGNNRDTESLPNANTGIDFNIGWAF